MPVLPFGCSACCAKLLIYELSTVYCSPASCLHPHTHTHTRREGERHTERELWHHGRGFQSLIPLTNLVSIHSLSAPRPALCLCLGPFFSLTLTSIIRQLFSISQFRVDVFSADRSIHRSLTISLSHTLSPSLSLYLNRWGVVLRN